MTPAYGDVNRLRVLLIRKDSKLKQLVVYFQKSLRVLLIRKDSKQNLTDSINNCGLRVLLIRKDSKRQQQQQPQQQV